MLPGCGRSRQSEGSKARRGGGTICSSCWLLDSRIIIGRWRSHRDTSCCSQRKHHPALVHRGNRRRAEAQADGAACRVGLHRQPALADVEQTLLGQCPSSGPHRLHQRPPVPLAEAARNLRRSGCFRGATLLQQGHYGGSELQVAGGDSCFLQLSFNLT